MAAIYFLILLILPASIEWITTNFDNIVVFGLIIINLSLFVLSIILACHTENYTKLLMIVK